MSQVDKSDKCEQLKKNDNQGQLQRQLSPTHEWAMALGAKVSKCRRRIYFYQDVL